MRSRPVLVCLAAAALFFAACSTTTLVASDNRPSQPEASAEEAPASEEPEAAEPSINDSATAEPVEDGGEPEDAPDENEAIEEEADPQTPRDLEEEAGFGLGGAEQLGGLVADCEDGDDLACDILFQLSDFDSNEETVALSCGGRSETETLFCTSDVDALPEQLVFDPDSAGIATIVTQCEDDGDLTACDFLYFRSPVGSEMEEIGATCGGRVNVAVPDCRTFLTE